MQSSTRSTPALPAVARPVLVAAVALASLAAPVHAQAPAEELATGWVVVGPDDAWTPPPGEIAPVRLRAQRFTRCGTANDGAQQSAGLAGELAPLDTTLHRLGAAVRALEIAVRGRMVAEPAYRAESGDTTWTGRDSVFVAAQVWAPIGDTWPGPCGAAAERTEDGAQPHAARVSWGVIDPLAPFVQAWRWIARHT